ncbi:MAG: NUDIX domain-containing protein [Cyanobacteria bacterium J06623_7]
MSNFSQANLISTEVIPVVMAIIYRDDKYLMQLRDDIPHIAYPGVWGFFGGHLEPGESPEVGLKRELVEEINYLPQTLTKFRTVRGGNYLRHLFSCPLTVPVAQLELNEGWDLKLLTVEEIIQGHAYSARAIANKAVGAIHRQIMLDFIDDISQN